MSNIVTWQSGLPIPFVIFFRSRLIERGRMSTGVDWLSLLSRDSAEHVQCTVTKKKKKERAWLRSENMPIREEKPQTYFYFIMDGGRT